MMPNYHEGATNGIYCHEGATKHPQTAAKQVICATKQAQITTKCHEKVPPVPPHTPPANASLGRGSAFAQKSNSELRKIIDA
jgi:hypothetical protein